MRVLFLALAFVFVNQFGIAQNLPTVACAAGLSPKDCDLGKATVRLALRQLDVPFPEWRWVAVPSSSWEAVSRSLRSNPNAPAFTLLEAHTTYIQYSLIHESPADKEALLKYTKRSGIDRLRWVLAHESGHIFCDTRDERKAEDTGKLLEFGSRKNRTYSRLCGGKHGADLTVAEGTVR